MVREYRYLSKKSDGSWTPGTAIGVVGKTGFKDGCWWLCDSAEHNDPGSFTEGGQFRLRGIAGPTPQTFDLNVLLAETEAFLFSVDGVAVKEVG
jgi:hypothetical protein